MKKLVSLILAVALLLSTVPAYADEQTPGWRGSDAAGWRYVDENGEYVAGDWVVITKGSGTEAVTKYYYIKEDTYMAKGWLQIEGDWYYFNEDGGLIEINDKATYSNSEDLDLYSSVLTKYKELNKSLLNKNGITSSLAENGFSFVYETKIDLAYATNLENELYYEKKTSAKNIKFELETRRYNCE